MRKYLLAGAAAAALLGGGCAAHAATTFTVVGCVPYQGYETAYGTSYTADANGNITGVPAGTDLRDLTAAGCRTADTAQTVAGNGLVPTYLRISDGHSAAGAANPAAATTGVFGYSITLGTSAFLVSEAANSSTKTDTTLFEVVLPKTYVAGQAVTLTVNAQYVLGSGTVGTHTTNAHAYLTAKDGTEGSDLINVSAATTAASAGDLTFTIPGATLTPGARLILSVVQVIQDTGGSNITSQINSLKLS